MAKGNSIVEYKFKPGLNLEFEILNVKDLYAKNKKLLTSPHRANFYHIIWVEKGDTTQKRYRHILPGQTQCVYSRMANMFCAHGL
jgi:hypothetical protein